MTGLPRVRAYNNQPFDLTTEMDVDDFYLSLAPGLTTFTLANKTNLRLGSTLQANLVFYKYFNSDFIKSGSNQFITSSPVATGANLVAPGISPITFSAYDVTVVDSNTCATENQVAFYVGDNTDIATQIYLNRSTDPLGIPLQFRDQIGYGATQGMMSLACATADEFGTPMTWVNSATGPIYLAPIMAQSQICADTLAGATVLTLVSDADVETFQLGTFIVIDKGGPNEETTLLVGASSNTVTVTKTDNDHDIGESVFHNAYKVWGKLDVPVNYTSHTAQTYQNISLYVRGTIQVRD